MFLFYQAKSNKYIITYTFSSYGNSALFFWADLDALTTQQRMSIDFCLLEY